MQTAIDALKSAVSSNDTAAMNRAMEQLTQAQHKAAEALYKQAGATASGAPEDGQRADSGAAAGQGSAPGDVIDAEVVEDEKK